jgi:hypothetical protein
MLGEAQGELMHQLLAVRGARFSALLDLDDLPPDQPVRDNHRRVDRARRLPASSLDDLGDALVQVVVIA